MAIVSIGSYEPTTLEFYDNWGLADAELPDKPIVLIGNYDRATFFTDRATLLVSIDDANTRRRAARAKGNARDALRIALTQRATQFRLAVQSQVGDALILKRVPGVPRPSLELSKFTAPLKAVAELWAEINGAAQRLQLPAPLTLQGGYAVAQFVLDLAQVQTLSDEADTAERAASAARGVRDLKLKAIYQRMKQYRLAAQAQLPKTSPVRRDLPRLTPAPGTKPTAVAVSGAWDAELGKGRLTWKALANATGIAKLQVRACVGNYKADDEEVVADLPLNATHYETDWELALPGAVASFKVYVMAANGNENADKAVKITHPNA